MDKNLDIKSNDTGTNGLKTGGSSKKLLTKSDSQSNLKNRVFSAGHSISQQNVKNYNPRNRIDVASQNEASRDTFQSRSKLLNDRYQLNGDQNGSMDKRPITANPTTANQILHRRKMIQS